MNYSSKTILSIAAAAIIGVTALGFISGIRSRRAASDESLSVEVQQIIGKWTVSQIPLRSRVINLVLGDVRGAEEPLTVSDASPSGGFGSWLGQLFSGPKSPTAEPRTELAKRLSAQPGFVTWTFDGFSTADEKAAVQDLMLSIIKAHDAGAEINMMAHGDVGEVVLKALKSVEGQVRNKVPVGANKVILLGMNSQRLKMIDPAFFTGFKRPGNVIEWSNVHAGTKLAPAAPAIEFYDAKHEGVIYPGKAWLGPSAQVSVQMLSDKIIGLVSSDGTMELFMNLKEVAALQAKAAEAAAAVASKSGAEAPPDDSAAALGERRFRSKDDGQVRTRGEPSQTPSAAPQDSLSMIKGGKEMGEAMKAAESKAAAAASKSAPASDPKGQRNAPEAVERERQCARCCGDVGGSWLHQNDYGRWATERGCCQGADYKDDVASCRAAVRCGSLFSGSLRFRCSRR